MRMIQIRSLVGTLLCLTIFGSKGGAAENLTRLSSHSFGKLSDGREVRAFVLKNTSGMSVQILDLGGIITSLSVPDSSGVIGDVTTGFDYPQPYVDGAGYMGAVVGRYANRISEGTFSVDGVSYSLAKNNGNKLPPD